MTKYIYRTVFICAILLLSAAAKDASGDERAKDVEIAKADIYIDYQQLPAAAYLCVTLKNNSDRKVSKLNFEVRYYDEEDYLIQKAIVKNTLNEAVPPGETGKYRIRLKGDIVNIDNEQYPYDQASRVARYDVKIIKVGFAYR